MCSTLTRRKDHVEGGATLSKSRTEKDSHCHMHSVCKPNTTDSVWKMLSLHYCVMFPLFVIILKGRLKQEEEMSLEDLIDRNHWNRNLHFIMVFNNIYLFL